jgi:4-methyl-5(b-hydroxyethyl)-thiazole monophosphate biosynthesis
MIVVCFAEGTEEVEALTVVDLLRRAELDVVIAGLTEGPIKGSKGIRILPDQVIDQIDVQSVSMLVLPGGMPGTRHLLGDDRVDKLLRAVYKAGRPVAAICAAPMILGQKEILIGKEAVCYPGFEDQLTGAKVAEGAKVIVDGNVITSKGLGTAIDFSLALIEKMKGTEAAKTIQKQICYETD